MGWNLKDGTFHPLKEEKYYRGNFQARRTSQVDSILEEVTVNRVSAMNCGC